MVLSEAALNLLAQLFSKQSNLQLPVGVADEVVEVRNAVTLALHPPAEPQKSEAV